MHPHLFQFGHFILPTFAALVALGLIVSLLVCLRISRLLSLDTDKVFNLALLVIVVTLVGAKILMVAVNWPRYGISALAFTLAGSGPAQLTGIAAAILVSWMYARSVHLPIRRTADALAPAISVASSVIAVAFFEAGYSYGAPTHLPWAVVYSSPFAAPQTPIGIPLHPTQIYASLFEFVLFLALLWLLRLPHADGEVMGAWLYLSGLGDFFLAFLRGDGGGRLIGGAWSVTQWIAMGMVLSGGALWLRRASGGGVRYAG